VVIGQVPVGAAAAAAGAVVDYQAGLVTAGRGLVDECLTECMTIH